MGGESLAVRGEAFAVGGEAFRVGGEAFGLRPVRAKPLAGGLRFFGWTTLGCATEAGHERPGDSDERGGTEAGLGNTWDGVPGSS